MNKLNKTLKTTATGQQASRTQATLLIVFDLLWWLIDYINSSWPCRLIRFKHKYRFVLLVSHLSRPLKVGMLQYQERIRIEQNLDIEAILPAHSRAFCAYELLSSMALATIGISSLMTIIYTDNHFNSTSIHICYLPRIHLGDWLTPEFFNWICLFYPFMLLGWRYTLTYHERRMNLSNFLFLLFDRDRILLESNPQKAALDNRKYGCLNVVQRALFCRVQATSASEVYFVVRPNRTLKARDTLVRVFERTFITYYLLLIIWVPFTLMVAVVFAFAAHQQVFMPCEAIQTTRHQLANLFRAASSWCLTIMFVIECGLSYSLAATNSFFITFDCLTYWNQIDRTLDKLMMDIAALRHFHDLYQDKIHHWQLHISQERRPSSSALAVTSPELPAESKMHLSSPKLAKQPPQQGGGEREEPTGSLSSSWELASEFHSTSGQLKKEINEIQALISDYFGEIHRIDRFYSDVLSFFLLIWVISNGLLIFCDLNLLVISLESVFIRFMQVIGIIIVSIVSLLILILKSRTEPAYRKLNFLMAVDPSLDKSRWHYLLKYFTCRPRYGFTIFHSQLYKPLTYLKILSVVITFVFFLQNIRTFRAAMNRREL